MPPPFDKESTSDNVVQGKDLTGKTVLLSPIRNFS